MMEGGRKMRARNVRNAQLLVHNVHGVQDGPVPSATFSAFLLPCTHTACISLDSCIYTPYRRGAGGEMDARLRRVNKEIAGAFADFRPTCGRV